MAADTVTTKNATGTTVNFQVHTDEDGYLASAASRDTSIATYSAGGIILAANMATTLLDLVGLRGSATKTVRIKKIRLEAGATAGLAATVFLDKHTIANTGGTLATAPAMVPLDSTDAAATALAIVYTADPTIDASSKTMSCKTLTFTALTTAPGVVEWDFVKDVEHALVLRGVAQEAMINFNGVTPGANSTVAWTIQWTEETE